ncbi:MAG: thioesterase family protein [Myxococcota bacterium]
MIEVPIHVPRSAFTPREVARAGDLWRAFQEVAVLGSTAVGWPPERYRAAGVNFMMRRMVVRHDREVVYGEALTGQTWPRLIRRGTLFHRECRLKLGAQPLAAASQEWVHIGTVDGAYRALRSAPELEASFAAEDHGGPVGLPSFDARRGPEHAFTFTSWETWADPLGHVNHPVYVDWADEGLARVLRAAPGGPVDPVALVAVAEEVRFRGGVGPGDAVRVTTRLAGVTGEGHAVTEHAVQGPGGALAAKATLVRSLPEDEGRLEAALTRGPDRASGAG